MEEKHERAVESIIKYGLNISNPSPRQWKGAKHSDLFPPNSCHLRLLLSGRRLTANLSPVLIREARLSARDRLHIGWFEHEQKLVLTNESRYRFAVQSLKLGLIVLVHGQGQWGTTLKTWYMCLQ